MSSTAAYLLDSHALLWWWFDPERLSGAVQALLTDPTSQILVSAATVWELSLRHHRGKLPELASAIGDLPGLLKADGFQGLPITAAHGLRAGAYPQAHRDPFDRVLAAQAELDRLVLLSADPQLSTFPCQVPGEIAWLLSPPPSIRRSLSTSPAWWSARTSPPSSSRTRWCPPTCSSTCSASTAPPTTPA